MALVETVDKLKVSALTGQLAEAVKSAPQSLAAMQEVCWDPVQKKLAGPLEGATREALQAQLDKCMQLHALTMCPPTMPWCTAHTQPGGCCAGCMCYL